MTRRAAHNSLAGVPTAVRGPFVRSQRRRDGPSPAQPPRSEPAVHERDASDDQRGADEDAGLECLPHSALHPDLARARAIRGLPPLCCVSRVTPLLVAALFFAFIVGANDGAALLGSNLGGKAVQPLPGLLVPAIAIVVVPLVAGTAVADTLAHGLVGFGSAEGERALLVAVLVTIVIVYISSRLGLPTSVTHALTGGIIGAGIGAGLAINLATIARVLLALAVAPLAAGVGALVVTLVLVRIRVRNDVNEWLRHLHGLAYVVQGAAYAANDGQKLLAVMAIALATTPRALGAAVLVQLAILFAAGTAFGVRGLASRFRRLLPMGPMNTIVADYAASAAVLGSAFVGAPVSMSHATTAGLVGSAAVLETYRAVRWEQVIRIAATWLTTMPAATIVAALIAATVR